MIAITMNSFPDITITALNENTISIEFGDALEFDSTLANSLAIPTPEISQLLSSFRIYLLNQLQLSHPKLIRDHVTSYRSLVLYYNFVQLRAGGIKHLIENYWHEFTRESDYVNELKTPNGANAKIIDIPVYYSEETGPDLQAIANTHKITIETLIQKHTAKPYRIYAMGFAPGFAYMGFVAPELRMPRLSTPRTKVAKGSVGIAGAQTGIYPKASPGGWNIIGRCPIDLIDLARPIQECCLFNVGESVRFNAIDRQTFLSLGGTLKNGQKNGDEECIKRG
ncbi:MAG: allophanate hydrolase subunit 1 [Agarilytica sp.]